MLITEVLGNRSELSETELNGKTEERLVLTNLDLTKRIQRGTTDGGREIGLRLPSGFGELHDGDILASDGDLLITVSVEPSDVLVIRAESICEMAFVAHSLGNRHLQAQFFDADSEYGQEVMVVQYDHTVEHFLEHAKTPFTREQRVMPEAFRHAEHSH